MSRKPKKDRDVDYCWMVEVIAPASFSQNFWHPYRMRGKRYEAIQESIKLRLEQSHCQWRVRKYVRVLDEQKVPANR